MDYFGVLDWNFCCREGQCYLVIASEVYFDFQFRLAASALETCACQTEKLDDDRIDFASILGNIQKWDLLLAIQSDLQTVNRFIRKVCSLNVTRMHFLSISHHIALQEKAHI